MMRQCVTVNRTREHAAPANRRVHVRRLGRRGGEALRRG